MDSRFSSQVHHAVQAVPCWLKLSFEWSVRWSLYGTPRLPLFFRSIPLFVLSPLVSWCLRCGRRGYGGLPHVNAQMSAGRFRRIEAVATHPARALSATPSGGCCLVTDGSPARDEVALYKTCPRHDDVVPLSANTPAETLCGARA